MLAKVLVLFLFGVIFCAASTIATILCGLGTLEVYGIYNNVVQSAGSIEFTGNSSSQGKKGNGIDDYRLQVHLIRSRTMATNQPKSGHRFPMRRDFLREWPPFSRSYIRCRRPAENRTADILQSLGAAPHQRTRVPDTAGIIFASCVSVRTETACQGGSSPDTPVLRDLCDNCVIDRIERML